MLKTISKFAREKTSEPKMTYFVNKTSSSCIDINTNQCVLSFRQISHIDAVGFNWYL